ncbi:MAG: ComEC/Rec2 family competence protein [Bacteroidales bacterium]|nr:ComEC/Rec2 family competence protein [Bacteroidales bacterium]
MFVFVYFVLAWLSGLACGWFISPTAHGLMINLGLLFVVFIILLFAGRSFLLIQYGLYWSLVAAFLSGLCAMELRYPDPLFPAENSFVSVGKVLSLRDTPYHKQLVVKLLRYSDEHGESSKPCRVLIEIPSGEESSTIEEGDTIQMKASFIALESRSTVGEFSKRGYWAGFGVRYEAVAKSSNIMLIAKGSEIAWRNDIDNIRQELIRRIDAFEISSSNKSIITAMLFGDKHGLDRSQKQVFSTVGIMHLLAVSGLHVGIVFMALTKLLTLIGISEHGSINRLIATMVMWMYVLICGMPPSAVRAGGMLSLFGLSRLIGRPVNSMHLVAVVCFVHTVIEPVSIFSTGFQLSYLAIMGILIYFPRFKKKIPTHYWLLSKIRDMGSISLAAQSLTLPVVLNVFASFPVYFLLGNIILMPLGLFIFYYSLVVLIVQDLLPDTIFYIFLDRFMDVWIKLGSIIASLPGSRLIILDFPVYESLFYLGLLFVLRNGMRKSVMPPFLLLIYIAAWSAIGFFFTIYTML